MDIWHRRSITGIVFSLDGGAIAWKCQVQPTAALSTTKAKLLAAFNAGKHALYLQSILAEAGLPQLRSTRIFEDNASARLISQAAQHTRWTRHIKICHFALLDWVEANKVTLAEIDGSRNPADGLTK